MCPRGEPTLLAGCLAQGASAPAHKRGFRIYSRLQSCAHLPAERCTARSKGLHNKMAKMPLSVVPRLRVCRRYAPAVVRNSFLDGAKWLDVRVPSWCLQPVPIETLGKWSCTHVYLEQVSKVTWNVTVCSARVCHAPSPPDHKACIGIIFWCLWHD